MHRKNGGKNLLADPLEGVVGASPVIYAVQFGDEGLVTERAFPVQVSVTEAISVQQVLCGGKRKQQLIICIILIMDYLINYILAWRLTDCIYKHCCYAVLVQSHDFPFLVCRLQHQ